MITLCLIPVDMHLWFCLRSLCPITGITKQLFRVGLGFVSLATDGAVKMCLQSTGVYGSRPSVAIQTHAPRHVRGTNMPTA